MGNKDEALAWIEKAFERHSDVLTRLKVDPRFDPLRGDPRFQGLLRREDCPVRGRQHRGCRSC
jgi:hypothetical protein